MIAVRVIRDGLVVLERVFRVLPLSIGRDPDCDLPLADESVSRIHARLVVEESGGMALLDAGSRNGIHVGPRAVAKLAIAGRVRCRLGRVELELEPLSQATTVEIEAGEWQRFDQRRSSLHALGYLLSAVAAWLVLELLAPEFWSPLRERRGLQVAGEALGAAMAIAATAFALLVGLRAVGRRVRIADALQGLARIAWLWPAAALLSLASYYLASPSTHATLGGWLSGAATGLTVALLAGVRRIGPRLRFELAWGLVAVLLYGALELRRAAEETARGAPEARYSVQAPIAGWTGPAIEADTYLTRVESALREAARSVEPE